ncbi:MAG: hypothetical protein ACRD0U_05390 [Acidimicrobiales bacterium]
MPIRTKRSISMPPDLDAAVAAAASAAGTSYSGWIANAARKELTIRAGLAAVAAYEREEGAFSAEELAAAETWALRVVDRSARTGSRTRRSA